MYNIAALGELLIDFSQYGVTDGGIQLFARNPGGAPANVLAAAARLGSRTAFIGKVGDDMHGHFLQDTLDSYGICTKGLVCDERVFTTLAFVSVSPAGERMFSFARRPGADTCLTPDEVDTDILKHCRIFHIGSLSLTDEPARSATFHALATAKAAGAVIAYDPNYRAALWANPTLAMAQMRAVLPYVDFMKLSDEETIHLTDSKDPAKAAKALCAQGIRCVAVTLGRDGALICVDGQVQHIAGLPACVVDTTGAGDAFWGAFLHAAAQNADCKNLSLAHAVSYAQLGCATAALCVSRMGGIPAMPDKCEVDKLLSKSTI